MKLHQAQSASFNSASVTPTSPYREVRYLVPYRQTVSMLHRYADNCQWKVEQRDAYSGVFVIAPYPVQRLMEVYKQGYEDGGR